MINSANIGKHKIPRYIYHLTTQRNYESILNSGRIEKTEDQLCGSGVFMIELVNFFKRWGVNKDWGNSNLQNDLIHQVRRFRDGLVILKIPTEGLDMSKLKVRSQNKLFSWLYSHEKEREKISSSDRGDKMLRLRKLLFDTAKPDVAEHLLYGAPATKSSLYTKRKEAIEYIYKEDIPAGNIEKIGEIDRTNLTSCLQSTSGNPIKKIFLELLKNQPEIRGAELMG